MFFFPIGLLIVGLLFCITFNSIHPHGYFVCMFDIYLVFKKKLLFGLAADALKI